MLTITEKIHPITAVLNPDDSAALRDLIFQVDSHTKSLLQLETNLQVIGLDLKDYSLDKAKAKGGEDSLESGKFHNSSSHSFQGSGQKATEKTRTSEFDDNDGNYAEIDALREQILKSRSKAPAPIVILGQADSDSGKSNGPVMTSGQHLRYVGSPSTSTVPPGLYERVEEVLPSPFADYDLVRYLLDSYSSMCSPQHT